MKLSVKNEIIRMLFPDDIKCIVCGREMRPNRYGLCNHCKLEINDNFCLRCGRHKIGIGDYCDECSGQSLHFDEARSAVNYDGNAKNLIYRLKYGNAKYLANTLSQYLLDVLLLSDWQADCITYVPIHKSRQRKRGYNQAELLARELAERINLPCECLLEKSVKTPNQAKLNREARLENLKDSFSARETPPDHVILVDDVMTTGSTADECSRVLKLAGAKVVYVLTFASVPERPILDKPTQNITDFRK
ncbi:MAG: ComF family protein [Clostridiales bacterium]|nr:ComF family protein [Clostridiales bacterium]